ncbi:MAG: hypothetical protein HY927_11025 [Elusimicrobia bacterium]|nr:hypothetical protein [Elusimicrobiota bacterium]
MGKWHGWNYVPSAAGLGEAETRSIVQELADVMGHAPRPPATPPPGSGAPLAELPAALEQQLSEGLRQDAPPVQPPAAPPPGPSAPPAELPATLELQLPERLRPSLPPVQPPAQPPAAPPPGPSAPSAELPATLELQLPERLRPSLPPVPPPVQPPAAPPPGPSAPPAGLPATLELQLPERLRPSVPPPQPPPAPPSKPAQETQPALPVEAIPKDAGEDQIRPIAVVATQDSAAEIADLLRYLQDIGSRISRPIYLRVVCLHIVSAETIPATVALKVQGAEAVAAVAILKGLPDEKRAAIRAVLADKRFRFHLVESADIRNRSVLIDIMSDLLLVDPQGYAASFRWEGHGFDERHGIRR